VVDTLPEEILINLETDSEADDPDTDTASEGDGYDSATDKSETEFVV